LDYPAALLFMPEEDSHGEYSSGSGRL